MKILNDCNKKKKISNFLLSNVLLTQRTPMYVITCVLHQITVWWLHCHFIVVFKWLKYIQGKFMKKKMTILLNEIHYIQFYIDNLQNSLD